MGRKGKAQKHTAKEIAGKHKAAKEARGAAGGGGKGAKARKNAGGKVAVKCEICLSMQPNFKSMTLHFENKHPKADWKTLGPQYEAKFNSGRDAVKKQQFDSKQKKDKGGKKKSK
eukprot:g1096.t1